MPTTGEETRLIASILDSNIDCLTDFDVNYPKKNLTRELAEKIGFITDNYSVRKSLFDLCRHYNPEWRIPEEIIDDLVDKWHNQKSDIELAEFIGMNKEDWELYCQGKYQCF